MSKNEDLYLENGNKVTYSSPQSYIQRIFLAEKSSEWGGLIF